MSSQPVVGLVVEGHGDVTATPILLRRVLAQHDLWPRVLQPHRVPKTRMRQDLGRATRLQLSRVGSLGGVLILVDADGDDPHWLADQLSKAIEPDVITRCRVVVAVKEYEAWFLGSIESLRAHKSVSNDASFAGDPEAPRDAKGALNSQMLEAYQEPIHQGAFSAEMDLDAAVARCASFAEFCDKAQELTSLTD